MKMLGIDTNSNFLIYEGSTLWGYPIWPSPTLIAVDIVNESADHLVPSDNQHDILQLNYVLIDEGYDPTSRIRKGRLFKRHGNSQPQNWHVKPHPLDSMEQLVANASLTHRGVIQKSLGTYSEFSLSAHLKTEGINRPLFILGNKAEFTIWSLVDVEATISGEPLIYLKARRVFGAVPGLIEHAIPIDHYQRIREKLDTLAEDVYRASIESVIDRAREAITAILSAYLQDRGHAAAGEELGRLADLLERKVEPTNTIVIGQARTVARLHSRGKNAEQEKGLYRTPTEQDAELAVQSVGIILRDLGWAK
jgi:hypothetical protein